MIVKHPKRCCAIKPNTRSSHYLLLRGTNHDSFSKLPKPYLPKVAKRFIKHIQRKKKNLFSKVKAVFFFLIFYWIIGFGVHEQSMQDSCIGTHLAVCFAFLLPYTHIWHFSPGYPSPPPPPTGPPHFPPIAPLFSTPLSVSMCSHFSSPTYK